MSSGLTIGRLSLGPPSSAVQELMGDPVGQIGSAIVAAPRVPLQITLDPNTILSGAATLAQAQTLRRQLRSALNNGPLKLQMFLYLQYADDPEQNGWLVPSPMTFASPDGTAWKAVGLWQTQGTTWFLAGRRWSMKEARSVVMKDLRTGLFERDQLRWILSTDFSWLSPLQLICLPNGASTVTDNVTDAVIVCVPMPAGRDGGVCQLAHGVSDLAAVSFERTEAARNTSDVIVYDRRGHVGPFGVGDSYDTAAGLIDPQSAYGWEEVYGPDYPWSWMNAGGTPDGPCVENGLVRVRYDATNKPGFRVDVWNGSAYVEQGKMIFFRTGDVSSYLDTWVSGSLIEYTMDRAVMCVVLASSTDAYSHERIFITVQRGERNVRFEYYGAPKFDRGLPCDASMRWSPALTGGVPDVNVSAAKIDAQGGLVYPHPGWSPSPSGSGAFAASAGGGAGTGHSGLIGAATLGNANFSVSENWVAILRCPTAFATVGAYQAALAVLQAANVSVRTLTDSNAFGATDNVVSVDSQNGAGYLQVRVSFADAVAQQVMEAESLTLGAATSLAVDAAASGTGSNTTQSTRTTDANEHVSQANWPNSKQGSYRVFARAKASANTASMYVETPGMDNELAGLLEVHTAADDAAVGTVAWTNPGRAVNNNPALPATNVLPSDGLAGHYLKFTNFGFNIRPSAAILGCTMTVNCEADDTNAWVNSVKLVKAGAVFGAEWGDFANLPSGGAPTSHQWASDGQGLIGADVNASNFGFALSVQSAGGAVTASCWFAYMLILYAGANEAVTVAAGSYSWYDLGDAPAGGTMQIHGWMSGGAGTFSLDRIEAVLTEDRVANGAIYAGARDQGQAALMDARTIGAIAVR